MHIEPNLVERNAVKPIFHGHSIGKSGNMFKNLVKT